MLYNPLSLIHQEGNLLTSQFVNPPASEASREVVNLIERKNPHTPLSTCVLLT